VTENAYLVGLRLAGKKVVVVGGGTVAQRRLHGRGERYRDWLDVVKVPTKAA